MSESRSEHVVPICVARLLMDHAHPIDREKLQKTFVARLPHARVVTPASEESPWLIFHEDRIAQLLDGRIPGQTVVMQARAHDPASLVMPLYQSWDFPNVREVVKNATCSVDVLELMTQSFSPQLRAEMFAGALGAVLDEVSPVAVHMLHAQRILEPETVRSSLADPHGPKFASTLMNVRLFRLEGQDELVMDTLGLCTFGLPDVQIHFRDLDPGMVASFLFSLGTYIFERGDCIQDGHTVQGLTPDSRWSCQHETSLIEPDRVVLDVHPGAPFAAGNRT